MGDFSHRLDIHHVQHRVADRFGKNHAGLLVDQGLEALRLQGIGKPDLDAELGQNVIEHRIGAPVKVHRRYNLITLAADVDHRVKYCRGAGSQGQAGSPAFQSRHALLEDILGRIHQTGINIAQLLQSKEVGRMLGISEYVGTGTVNRNAPGPGFVRNRAGMQGQRVEFIGIGHNGAPFCINEIGLL